MRQQTIKYNIMVVNHILIYISDFQPVSQKDCKILNDVAIAMSHLVIYVKKVFQGLHLLKQKAN